MHDPSLRGRQSSNTDNHSSAFKAQGGLTTGAVFLKCGRMIIRPFEERLPRRPQRERIKRVSLRFKDGDQRSGTFVVRRLLRNAGKMN